MRLLVQPVAAALVDRWRRRTIVLAGNLLNAVLAASFIAIRKPDQLWIAYALVALLQTVDAFTGPAERAVLPDMVSRSALVSANAWLSVAGKTASLIGPALAGLLYVYLGPLPLFLLNGLSFVAAAAAAWAAFPRDQRMEEGKRASLWHDAWFGVSWAIRHRDVAIILVSALLSSLIWRVMEIVLVPASSHPLAIGPSGLGLLYSCLAAGGLAGAATVRLVWTRHTVTARTTAVAYAATGAPLLVLALVPTPAVAYCAMAVAGAALEVSAIFSASSLQEIVPADLRGRVFGTLNVARAVGVLPVLAGLTAVTGSIGIMGTVAVAALLTLAGGGFAALPRGTVTKGLPQ